MDVEDAHPPEEGRGGLMDLIFWAADEFADVGSVVCGWRPFAAC